MKERLAQSVARIGRMVMFRSAILVLSFARLSLVEGAGVSSKPPSAKNLTEIGANSDRRILYGDKAALKDFRYLTRIERLGIRSVCAGAIINRHWIVTAAQCILGAPCSGIRIVPVGMPKRKEFVSSQCVVHPRKHIERFEYDIGLVKVRRDLLGGYEVKALKLPPPGKIYPPGTRFTISGWGKDQHNAFPPHLLKANVALATWEECNNKFHENEGPGSLDMPIRTLCLQGDGPTPPGTCFGDTGGPAATSDGIIVGVASFVLQDGDFCKIGGPSMFTSIVDYLPWIYSHIEPKRDTSSYPVRPEHELPKLHAR